MASRGRQVDLEQLRDWILPLSAGAAILLVAAGAWLTLGAYRRKLRAEERLARTACAEADVRLVHTFTDLMLLAAGTGRYTRSGELLRAMLEKGVIGKEDFDDAVALHTKVLQYAMMPATAAGPTACGYAVHGLAALAARHELLRELGIRALDLERVRTSAPDQVQALLRGLRGQA
jgi:hypothetical protein